jgi:signal transduction histidine kinase
MIASVLIALAAIVVLGTPLTILAVQHVRDEAWDRLEREARTAGALVGDEGLAVPAARLRAVAGPDVAVVVTSAEGATRTIGAQPSGDAVRESAMGPEGTKVTLIAPAGLIDDGVGEVLLVAGLSAVVGLAAAAGLGWWLSRRFARPLEALAATSRRLGTGDFGVRAGRYDLPEIDAVAAALDRTAGRLGDLVARERAFSGNVAHQLRTPLTALRLRLEELAEAADPATRSEAEAALDQADRMERTIEDLLALAREGRTGFAERVDLAELARDRVRAWAPAYRHAGRPLAVEGPVRVEVRTVRGAVEQALDVLLENALRHGGGTVRVGVRGAADHATLSVSDEGAGIPDELGARLFDRRGEDGAGTGLPLARALVEAAGGRVRLSALRPARFDVLLPSSEPVGTEDAEPRADGLDPAAPAARARPG